MSDKNFKEIRKQLRNVSKDTIKDLLTEEVYASLELRLRQDMVKELGIIQSDIAETLATIDERSKNVQQFIMNQISTQLAQNTTTPTDTTLAPVDSNR